jgi:hypothetical protein
MSQQQLQQALQVCHHAGAAAAASLPKASSSNSSPNYQLMKQS